MYFPFTEKVRDSIDTVPLRGSIDTVPLRGSIDTVPLRGSIDTVPLRGSIDTVPKRDSIADKLNAVPDTASMDSLQLAIWKHNKQIDDSLYADSLNRQRKSGIDAPVEYTAEDSMTYEGDTKLAFLYGKAHVKYQNMDLESDKMYMSMDSSLVHAMGSRDTTGKKYGLPVFKMGSDTYETDTMSFNFKTKKGLISNVYTQQSDGFMTSELSKRGANGDMFLLHGRYTTCDEPHPDFYFAMFWAFIVN